MSHAESLESRFVTTLTGYAERDNRAALAALRRGAGRRPGSTPEMFPWVVPLLPQSLSRRREEAFYLVAALFALHPVNWVARRDQPWTNLGASFARLAQGRDSQSIERRFTSLLASHPDDLAVHLRHAISLLASDDVPVDWERLLRDIPHWTHSDRWVQRNMARAFWGAPPEEGDKEPDSAAETSQE